MDNRLSGAQSARDLRLDFFNTLKAKRQRHSATMVISASLKESVDGAWRGVRPSIHSDCDCNCDCACK